MPLDAWDQFPDYQPPAAAVAPAADPWAAFPDAPVAQPAPVEEPSAAMSTLLSADRKGAIALRGARKGIAALAGAPVDAANFLLKQVGLGSDAPIGGSQTFDTLLGAPAAATSAAMGGEFSGEGPKPEDGLERVIERVGYELGANAVPVGGALTAGRVMGVPAARKLAETGSSVMQRLGGQAAHSAAVNPAGLAARETAYAAAAGTGAGLANEAVGAPQHGDNFWSDLIGSLAGVGVAGGLNFAGRTAKEAFSPIVGREQYFDEIAGEHAASRMVENSSAFQQTPQGSTFDTSQLVEALRRPSDVEQAVPGYQSNIGDRAQDPGLQDFAFNINGRPPGSGRQLRRRTDNEVFVNERVGELAPDGDPALFRDALERSRTAQLSQVDDAATRAQAEFERLFESLSPVLQESSARGSQARAVLAEAYENAQDATRAAYDQVRDNETLVPIEDLAERFRTTTESLPLNDRQRFLPSEAGVPRTLAQVDEGAAGAGVPPARTAAESLWARVTGQGAETPPTGPQRGVETPFNEVMSIRSGLTDDVRGHRAAGKLQAARIADRFRQETDDFIENNLPESLQENYATARAARHDQANRFERPGTGIGDILKPREGGGYRLDDSAVPQRILQRDTGKLSDFQAVMREGGNDPRMRQALEDELMSDIRRRRLADRPEALTRYLDEYREVFRVFPELRQRVTNMAGARNAADAAGATAAATRRDLTTPSRSPVAAYLKHGNEATSKAMQSLISGDRSAEAARQLVDQAGGDADALANARAAFWTVVSKKRYKAAGVTGERRWDAGAVRDMLDDPKADAVARELWRDSPQELEDIRELFATLAGAEGSSRARAAGSSGTGQIVSEKFDPALSAGSISARFRAVQQGRASLPVTGVSLAADFLRRARLAGKRESVDRIMAEAVNNPGLAADLLERHNPADFAAKRRMVTQKYGQRLTALFNALDEDEDAAPAAASR